MIFICKFDPFDKGFCKYTFANTCKEDSSLTLGDGTARLFFNSTGKMPDTEPNPDLETLLTFIEDGTTGDTFTKRLETEVETVKQNKKSSAQPTTPTFLICTLEEISYAN